MVVSIQGKRMYLWRAVDSEGEVLDLLVQPKRDTKAALRLMRKLLKKQGYAPDELVTDKLGSYGAARRELRLSCRCTMGRLIAARCASPLFGWLTFAGFRVVFAVGTGPLHDGSSRGWDLPRWTTHSADPAVHPIKRDGPAHVPAGTSGKRSRANACL
jgi:DDE domain